MKKTLIAVVAAAGLAYAGGMQVGHADGRDTAAAGQAQAAAAPVRGVQPTAAWGRLQGANRYETSARLSAAVWDAGRVSTYPGTVFVATGTGFADGLSAGAAAAPLSGPLLLVPSSGSLPAATAKELKRLKPKQIYIVGGEPSVSAGLAQELKGYLPDGTAPRRFAGENRYGTAASVASLYKESDAASKTVYLASGETFADALPASSVAGRAGSPLLLTRRGSLPTETADQLKRLAPTKVVVVGGAPTIADSVLTEVKAVVGSAVVERAAGASRYGTAASLSKGAYPSSKLAYLVSGEKFPDALSVSAVAGASGGTPMLLSRQRCMAKEADAELTRLKTETILIIGGEASVSDAVVTKLC